MPAILLADGGHKPRAWGARVAVHAPGLRGIARSRPRVRDLVQGVLISRKWRINSWTRNGVTTEPSLLDLLGTSQAPLLKAPGLEPRVPRRSRRDGSVVTPLRVQLFIRHLREISTP